MVFGLSGKFLDCPESFGVVRTVSALSSFGMDMSWKEQYSPYWIKFRILAKTFRTTMLTRWRGFCDSGWCITLASTFPVEDSFAAMANDLTHWNHIHLAMESLYNSEKRKEGLSEKGCLLRWTWILIVMQPGLSDWWERWGHSQLLPNFYPSSDCQHGKRAIWVMGRNWEGTVCSSIYKWASSNIFSQILTCMYLLHIFVCLSVSEVSE